MNAWTLAISRSLAIASTQNPYDDIRVVGYTKQRDVHARSTRTRSRRPAPAAGTYEQINIFGRSSGMRIDVSHRDPFPLAPIGHMWRSVEENGVDCGGRAPALKGECARLRQRRRDWRVHFAIWQCRSLFVTRLANDISEGTYRALTWIDSRTSSFSTASIQINWQLCAFWFVCKPAKRSCARGAGRRR
jgi:hypothetical protein